MACRYVILTEETAADCTQAPDPIADVAAQHLLADRGYDSGTQVDQAEEPGMEAAIPPAQPQGTPELRPDAVQTAPLGGKRISDL
jgi:hypothetical protein